IAVLDIETTIKNKGNHYTQGNYVVLGGFYNGQETFFFDWKAQPSDIENYLRRVKLLVVFNGKFDLAWLLVMGVSLPPGIKIWDCQLAEFY
ncbi:hypothetical protein DD876_12870, partial [Staphylococcus pseudintermedius]|uniref:hypothetical protein n=1 Tax=Staphylococcus pseudintermedius TaxID=283734 RepID=UPI000D89C83D